MLRPISDTAFARPQITEVVEREAPAMLIYDVEFADTIADVRAGRPGTSCGTTIPRPPRPRSSS